MAASPLGSDRAAVAVRMLGGLQVRRDGLLLPRPFPTRKTASLFAFLLLHPNAEFSRHFLAGTFWPDVDEDAALRSLSAALVPIRRFLEPGPEDRGRYLVSPRDALCLIPPPGCWVDVWAFQHAEAEAKGVPAGSPEWFAILEGAVALYGEDLLLDYGDEWCFTLREELRQRLLGYLHDLTRADQQRKQYSRACDWARRALAADRCDEESHRSLMRLHAQLWEYSKAIQQYRECRRALREELEAAPDPETIALYQWLQEQQKRPRPVPSPAEPAFLDLDLLAPLVGRDREQDRLRAAWERARSGRGELVLLSGESGIGKSRLGRQLLQEVALDQGLALYGQASALESSFLYRPLIDPLRRALELAAERGLTLCDPIWMAQVARLLPEVPLPEGSLVAPNAESPRLLEEGLAQLLLTLASQRPLCLFLDDLQWADAATGRFLHYLARQSSRERLLVIGAYREGEVLGSDWLGPWLIDVEAQRMAASLPLARLNAEEVERLLGELARGQASEALLQLLGQRLHEETEGNPLFLLVTLRHLFERGYLTLNEDRHWRIASDRLVPAGGAAGIGHPPNAEPLTHRLPVPPTVQRVVHQRVSRLREEDQHLLQYAAVIGRRFSFEALRRTAGQPMEATLDGVERLLAADLISAQAHPAAFDFRHDKIREVVYEDLLPIRCQELHRRVGEALEQIYDIAGASVIEEEPYPTWSRRPPPPPTQAKVEEHAEELAYHFHQAAPVIGPEKAIYYYYLAGTRARALCAYEKAVSDLVAAKSLLEELPPDKERLAQLGQIVEQLAPAYRSTFQREEGRQLLKDYIALSEEHLCGRGIARGCVLLGLFLELTPALADTATSQSLYERAIAVCETYGLDDWVVYPRSMLASRLAYSGDDVARAEALVRACLPHAEARRDARVLTRLYNCQMWIAMAQTDWEAFRNAFRKSLTYGGVSEIYLAMLLKRLEETCYQQKTPGTFVALCRDMAEEYARTGMEAPFQQWHLAPTVPRTTRSEPTVYEEFAGEGCHPALEWQDVTGRSRLDRTTRPGWLGLYPARDADLWPEKNLNAPRLVATVQGNFVAQIRVELGKDAGVYAGLILWQDAQNFVRLELNRVDEKRIEVILQGYLAARARYVGRGNSERRPMWLRVERVGEEIRGLCSADGDYWLTCGALHLARRREEVVGLAAHSSYPGDHAWFDTFLLWHEEVKER